MMKKLLPFIILNLAMTLPAFAQVLPVQTTAAPANLPETLCPPIDKITKDPTEGNWKAQMPEGTWKSYSLSFATSLTRFVGAQWVGADVGQITCVYHSEQEFMMQGQQTIQRTLPVLLVFHTLAFQPSGANWAHASKGVYNCSAGNKGQADCPFKVNMPPTTGDIYEEAAALKEKAPDPLQPPSY
jgi:hypothetical protein